MRERVAEALYDDEFGVRAWADLLSSAKLHKLTRPTATERKYLQRAYTAIEALRAPTEEMLAAADSAIPRFEPDENGHRLMGRDGALDVWRAMIDTALPLPSSTAGREG